MAKITGTKKSGAGKGILLVITGPSGVGKDSVIGEFLKRNPDFKKIVTDTSRPPRAGEVNGIDYNFLTPEEFLDKAAHGYYLEHVEVRPKEYKGMPAATVTQILSGGKIIWKTDEYAAAHIAETFSEKLGGDAPQVLARTVTVYLAPEEWKQLREQYFERESEANKAWFRIKLKRDKEMWKKYHSRFEFVVTNRRQQMPEAVKDIEKIVSNKAR